MLTNPRRRVFELAVEAAGELACMSAPRLRAHGCGRGGEGRGKNADSLLTLRPGVRPEGHGIRSPLRAHRLDIASNSGGRDAPPSFLTSQEETGATAESPRARNRPMAEKPRQRASLRLPCSPKSQDRAGKRFNRLSVQPRRRGEKTRLRRAGKR